MSSLILVPLIVLQLWGGESSYIVRPGDTLVSLSARFGIDIRVLAVANDLTPTARLTALGELKIDNRHLIPAAENVDIVINVPQRMLFYFEENQLVRAYPITAGSPGWKTTRGEFTIISKEEHPTWDVPASIQAEMRRNGKPVLTRVPPSPQNPLGEYWLGLSLDGIGIHGTNAPLSIYRLVSHGCIRLHPDDIKDLFSRVDTTTKGRIIYRPLLLTKIGDKVFIEIHPDAYRASPDPMGLVHQLATAGAYADVVDWTLIREAIHKKDGIARDVTRR
jgi:L,D-transpeptidase ErfK/SrfK